MRTELQSYKLKVLNKGLKVFKALLGIFVFILNSQLSTLNCLYAQGTAANSILTNGGDSGTLISADSPGDTFITGNFIGSYAIANSTSILISTGYAIGSLAAPPDQTIASVGTTIYFSYSVRNRGNASDKFSLSLSTISGQAWSAYILRTDSVTQISESDSLASETTFYFLVGISVPSGAAQLSSTTVRLTVKDHFGLGTDDQWPQGEAQNDTLTDELSLAVSPLISPPIVLPSTLTVTWLTAPPMVTSSETLTFQWQVFSGTPPYSAKVVHLKRSGETIEDHPVVSGSGVFSNSFNLESGANLITVTVKESSPSFNSAVVSTSIFRGVEMKVNDGGTVGTMDLSQGSAFYRTIANSEATPFKVEVNNGMAIELLAGTFTGSVMVQVSIGAVPEKLKALKGAPASGSAPVIALIPGNERNMLSIDVMGSGGKVQPLKPVTLTIPYQDPTPSDPNDDLGFRIAFYNEAAAKWEITGKNLSIDSLNDKVKVDVDHFTLFTTVNARAPATDLTNFIIYPNPFRPNSGDARKGKDYSLADQESGIIFDGLTDSANIRIYTLTGEKVRELHTPSGTSRMRWDVKNENGETVVSGVYFYLVTDSVGRKVSGKLAIIR